MPLVANKVTANFTRNAGNFHMSQTRYDAIVQQSEHEEEWVNSALFYDWENANDHQYWLDEAHIDEIVSWVNETIDSWK